MTSLVDDTSGLSIEPSNPLSKIYERVTGGQCPTGDIDRVFIFLYSYTLAFFNNSRYLLY